MIRAEPNYVAMSDAWEELDEQIQALQDAKKDIAGRLREEHGKIIADAFKAAMKIRRMDSEKRSKAEEVDAEAFRILGILSAPRATRIAKDVPTATAEGLKQTYAAYVHNRDLPRHDPATGEVFEPTVLNSQTQSTATAGDGPTQSPVTGPSFPANAQKALDNDEPFLEAGPQAEASHCQDTGVRTLADREGRIEGEAASADLPTHSPSAVPPQPVAPEQAASPPVGSGAQIPDEQIVAFLRKDHEPAKPVANERCEHPTGCRFAFSREKATCAKCTGWMAKRKAREAEAA